jgi:tRNA dimethylallyltransferase
MGEKTALQKIVIIVGPTASGKTDLAVRLAEKLGGEIVNADSMQVYRGMDIGTAKPSPELLSRVPHHLIDIVNPDMNFSASDFRREAAKAIDDISGRGKRVIVAGGTGLYIRALLRGLVDSPSGAGRIREELEEEAKSFGGEAMLAELARVDPVAAARLHPNDLVRIIRALEVYRLTGVPVSRQRIAHAFGEAYYSALKIGISVDRSVLYDRIDRRVEKMVADGLVDEVKYLMKNGFPPGLKSMRSIGYRQICGYIAGEFPFEEAVRLIKRDSRRYAKRQMTWFNSDNEINWVEYSDNFASIYLNVIDFFAKGEEHG